jgi:hypothetical protein
MNHPLAMAIDQWDNLHIADWYNHRVQQWTAGSTNGTTVAGRQNGTAGSDLSALNQPFDVFVDNSGGLYIADAANHRVVYWILHRETSWHG